MKRSHVLVLSCACALVLALFGLSACGGNDSASSSEQASNAGSSSAASANSSESSAAIDPNTDPADLSQDQVRSVFEQVTANMSEFYHGSTPASEELYYAGGADGDNAILALILPDSAQSVIFVGPTTVEEGTNKLTVTDETTGSSISFTVTSNEDGTISFSMGENSGATVMSRCSASDIVDALVQVVNASAPAEPSEPAEPAETSEPEQADQQ